MSKEENLGCQNTNVMRYVKLLESVSFNQKINASTYVADIGRAIKNFMTDLMGFFRIS